MAYHPPLSLFDYSSRWAMSSSQNAEVPAPETKSGPEPEPPVGPETSLEPPDAAPLTADEFREYNRLAEQMDVFVQCSHSQPNAPVALAGALTTPS